MHFVEKQEMEMGDFILIHTWMGGVFDCGVYPLSCVVELWKMSKPVVRKACLKPPRKHGIPNTFDLIFGVKKHYQNHSGMHNTMLCIEDLIKGKSFFLGQGSPSWGTE